MGQQWTYRAVEITYAKEQTVNEELARWAADGWELVNATCATGGDNPTDVWLFWRRAE